MLMRGWWLLVFATLAFVVVGCGMPSREQPRPAEAPTPDTAAQPESALAPTPEPPASVRTPAALLAINPQPAPQSGQVNISGKGFAAGESVTLSVSTKADAGAPSLPLANAVANADGA